MNLSAKDIERFWSKVEIRGEDDCWEWIGRLSPKGYGTYDVFLLKWQSVQAHRLSYILRFGDIPEGKQIHHVCSNRKCVNSKHLVALTPKEHSQADRSGENSVPRRFIEFLPRGDEHWARKHPELVKRGEEWHTIHTPENIRNGENATNVKLSQSEVDLAREMYADGKGLSPKEIANKLRRNYNTLYSILSGRNWKASINKEKAK